MRTELLVITAMAGLSACATDPIANCQSDAYREVRNLQGKISVIEENIERGYAIHRWTETSPQIGFCTSTGPLALCSETGGPQNYQRPVQIDVAQQRQTLADLRNELAAEQKQAELMAEACLMRNAAAR